MSGTEHTTPPKGPVRDAQAAVRRADEIRRRLIVAAEAVAETEDEVAATMARMAAERPADAARLRAKSEAAAQTAARERRWVAERRETPGDDSL